ncbi:MAG: tRNA 5-methoxyuridine(34)/uridine 5-oxyacetic acid(34) synthase CmoB, partial [Pseudomonadota bacterium]
EPDRVALDQPAVTLDGPIGDADRSQLERCLQALHPWRKGPFDMFGVKLDTEWRSDWKWERVAPALDDLTGRRVLDIGCGNGYHLWRMQGAGAELALGVDPTVLFSCQFAAVRHYVRQARTLMLALRLEELPPALTGFDTVFSMGILYHRRNPLEHLEQLKRLLRPGGQAIVETLVIAGDDRQVLLPEARYARMRNVWFVPSPDLLLRWLRRLGFRNVALVDVSRTTIKEQRSTPWMRFESLAECLDPDDATRTVEGYPAPTRAVITAHKP